MSGYVPKVGDWVALTVRGRVDVATDTQLRVVWGPNRDVFRVEGGSYQFGPEELGDDLSIERLPEPEPEPEPGTRVRARFGDVVIEGPTRVHFDGGSCIDPLVGPRCWALADADSWEIVDGAP